MEIFQTIWTALTTSNEGLIHILSIPLIFIEMTVTTLLSTTILNVYYSKKQKILYISILSCFTIISNIFIPQSYAVFINMVVYFISIKIIFKENLLKTLFMTLLPYIIIALLDSMFAQLLSVGFKLVREEVVFVPIIRLPIASFNYLAIYLLYRFAKHLKFNIAILDNIDRKGKIIIALNLLLVIVSIGTQFFIIGFYNDILPVLIVLLSILSLIIYFILSIFTLTRTTQLQIVNENLEQAQLYNKSLKILHDNVRAFKHDFSNIVQAIGRIY